MPKKSSTLSFKNILSLLLLALGVLLSGVVYYSLYKRHRARENLEEKEKIKVTGFLDMSNADGSGTTVDDFMKLTTDEKTQAVAKFTKTFNGPIQKTFTDNLSKVFKLPKAKQQAALHDLEPLFKGTLFTKSKNKNISDILNKVPAVQIQSMGTDSKTANKILKEIMKVPENQRNSAFVSVMAKYRSNAGTGTAKPTAKPKRSRK